MRFFFRHNNASGEIFKIDRISTFWRGNSVQDEFAQRIIWGGHRVKKGATFGTSTKGGPRMQPLLSTQTE